MAHIQRLPHKRRAVLERIDPIPALLPRNPNPLLRPVPKSDVIRAILELAGEGVVPRNFRWSREEELALEGVEPSVGVEGGEVSQGGADAVVVVLGGEELHVLADANDDVRHAHNIVAPVIHGALRDGVPRELGLETRERGLFVAGFLRIQHEVPSSFHPMSNSIVRHSRMGITDE